MKNARAAKEKKWLYNFAARILKLYNDNADTKTYSININSYYIQHYKGYYTNKYRKLDLKERKKISKKQMKTSDHNVNAREVMKQKHLIFKLYKEGKLSDKSDKIIEKKLKNLRYKNVNTKKR